MPNSEKEALEEAKRAVIQRRVQLSRHARERMDERGAGLQDVFDAMSSATKAEHQPPPDKWKLIGGRDLDGCPLVVVVVWTDMGYARIVTVEGD